MSLLHGEMTATTATAIAIAPPAEVEMSSATQANTVSMKVSRCYRAPATSQ
jgi:hypothetical protein